MYRVQKVLSLLGVFSRRECEKKIKLGLVKINNEIAKLGSIVSLGDKISYLSSEYIITERLLDIETKILIYHKAINQIVSRNDPQKRSSVFDMLPDVNGKWINIGRLDYKTSGLLLFTNNGDIANRMMHPSSNILRSYEVSIHGTFDRKKMELALRGIDIGNSEIGKLVEVTPDSLVHNKFLIKLKTGKNREVRRIFSKLDCKVISLKRISYGVIHLGKIKTKCYEYIDPKLIEKLI